MRSNNLDLNQIKIYNPILQRRNTFSIAISPLTHSLIMNNCKKIEVNAKYLGENKYKIVLIPSNNKGVVVCSEKYKNILTITAGRLKTALEIPNGKYHLYIIDGKIEGNKLSFILKGGYEK